MYKEACGQKGKENKSRYKENITEKNHKAKTNINRDASEFEQKAKRCIIQIHVYYKVEYKVKWKGHVSETRYYTYLNIKTNKSRCKLTGWGSIWVHLRTGVWLASWLPCATERNLTMACSPRSCNMFWLLFCGRFCNGVKGNIEHIPSFEYVNMRLLLYYWFYFCSSILWTILDVWLT